MKCIVLSTLVLAYAVSAKRNYDFPQKKVKEAAPGKRPASSLCQNTEPIMVPFTDPLTTEYFMTPNYPDRHNNYDCVRWLIKRPSNADASYSPMVTIIDFHTEYYYDFLYVYDFSDGDYDNRLFRWHGSMYGAKDLPADVATFMFEFDSDYSITKKGFMIRVEWRAPPPPPEPLVWGPEGNCDVVDGSPVMSCGLIRVSENKCAKVGSWSQDSYAVQTAICDHTDPDQQWYYAPLKYIVNRQRNLCWQSKDPTEGWASSKRASVKTRWCNYLTEANSYSINRKQFIATEFGIATAEGPANGKCIYGSKEEDSDPYLYQTQCHSSKWGSGFY